MGEKPVIGVLAERFLGSLNHFTGSPEDSFTIGRTPAGNAVMTQAIMIYIRLNDGRSSPF